MPVTSIIAALGASPMEIPRITIPFFARRLDGIDVYRFFPDLPSRNIDDLLGKLLSFAWKLMIYSNHPNDVTGTGA